MPKSTLGTSRTMNRPRIEPIQVYSVQGIGEVLPKYISHVISDVAPREAEKLFEFTPVFEIS